MQLTGKQALLILAGGGALGLAAGIYRYYTSEGAPFDVGGGHFSFVEDISMDSFGSSKRPELKFARQPPPSGSKAVLLLYGTEYGFSQELAKKMEEELYNLDMNLYPRTVDMEEFDLIEWDKENLAILFCSTYGDGVPPTRARASFDFMEANKLDLHHLKFSLLAMGDTSYPHYCKAGRTLDQLFENFGGQRIHNRSEVDQEDWPVIDRWFKAVLAQISTVDLPSIEQSDYLWDKVTSGTYEKKLSFDRMNPFYGTLVKKENLTTLSGPEDKETLHFEFDLGESSDAMKYIVGDSLGVLADNLARDVDDIIIALGVDGATKVPSPSWKYKSVNGEEHGDQMELRAALLHYYDLKNLKPKLIQVFQTHSEKNGAAPAEREQLKNLMEKGLSKDNTVLTEYLHGRELIDILETFGSVKVPLADILSNLGQLLPRYYSISSSYITDSSTVSITVAVVRYNTFKRDRIGVCSTHLSDRVNVGDRIPIFVNNNPDFRLPADPSKDILMVGPGTGIAPFRAMLQERVKVGATGKNVLYFGCRRSDSDFLYKNELEALQEKGLLKLHTAFSRQDKQKVYVQHKLAETGAEVWELLKAGGHIYICGDAQYMANDVHAALKQIVRDFTNVDEAGADKFLADLEAERRYQRDVWF